MSSPSIAFFDVDHTLFDGNSGYYTSLRLVRHGILKKRRILQAAYYSIANLFFQQNVAKIYEVAIADMAGNSIDRILSIGRECFDQDIQLKLFDEGIELVREHQQQGDKVVLLTAGPYMTIKILHDFLKTDEAYTMGPEIVDGILTNKLMLPICHAEGKLHFAELASQKFKVPLSECFFYTDDHSDLPLLEKVGKPNVVNPTHILKKTALSRGWPIHFFKSK